MKFLPLIIAMASLGIVRGVAYAGRPLVIDDASPVEFGSWQIEAGTTYLKDSDTHNFDWPLTLAYGLAPNLEVGAGSGAIRERRHDANGDEWVSSAADVLLAAKWRLFDDEQRAFSLALAPLVKLPVADDERGLGTGGTDYDLTLLMTKEFGRTALDLNVGSTVAEERAENNRDWVWHYGIALRREATSRLWIVGDVFATTPAGAGPTSVGMNVGVQYELYSSLVVDSAVGAGLHEGPDVTVTAGLTWVF